MFDDLSIEGLAAATSAGSVIIADLLAEARRRIDEHDQSVHAFLTLSKSRADDQIRVVDGRLGVRDQPLAGLPLAIKDNICTRGVRTTCASRILADWIPPYDATVVTKLEDAGAILVGKTNLDEFAMGSSTEFSAFGPTRNPYDPDRVPGGSSGGSAAAVAAGLVPAAIGSDTGGSVRQPAAHCGVVGVKPTYGRVSRYGLIAYGSSLDQIGPIARTVEDAARLLQVMAGHDPKDSTSVPADVPDFVQASRRDPSGIRVGVIREMLAEGVEPDVACAVAAAAEALTSAGATLSEVSVPTVGPTLAAYYLIATAEASSNLARFDGVRYGLRVDGGTVQDMMINTRTKGFGAEAKRRIMLGTFALSAGYQDQYYGKAQRVRTLLVRDLERVFQHCDVLLAPTSPRTAFRIGELTDDPLQMYLTDICTVTANMAGIPAASIPWGADRSGLPIGVQVMAPAFGEAVMFRACGALERVAPPLSIPRIYGGMTAMRFAQ